MKGLFWGSNGSSSQLSTPVLAILKPLLNQIVQKPDSRQQGKGSKEHKGLRGRKVLRKGLILYHMRQGKCLFSQHKG